MTDTERAAHEIAHAIGGLAAELQQVRFQLREMCRWLDSHNDHLAALGSAAEQLAQLTECMATFTEGGELKRASTAEFHTHDRP